MSSDLFAEVRDLRAENDKLRWDIQRYATLEGGMENTEAHNQRLLRELAETRRELETERRRKEFERREHYQARRELEEARELLKQWRLSRPWANAPLDVHTHALLQRTTPPTDPKEPVA